jgi:hypothetical protein
MKHIRLFGYERDVRRAYTNNDQRLHGERFEERQRVNGQPLSAEDNPAVERLREARAE